MDGMVEDLEEFLEEISKDTDKLIKAGIDTIEKNSGEIQTTLKSLSKEYGTKLSDAMKTTWGSYQNAAGGVDAIIKAFQNLLTETDKKNDQQAYAVANSKYKNYRAYNESIDKAKEKQDRLKEEHKEAKKEKQAAKEKLESVQKEHGKDSKQYQKAHEAWEKAKKAYETADKKYQASIKKLEALKEKKETVKETDKPIVQEFLSAIVDNSPTKPKKKMDELDRAVYKITGGYLTDDNRKQILDLFGVTTAKKAAKILEELGLWKSKNKKDKPKERKNPSNDSKPQEQTTLSRTVGDKLDTSRGHSFEEDREANIVQYITEIPEQEISGRIHPDDFYLVRSSLSETLIKQQFKHMETLDHIPATRYGTGDISINTGDLYLPNVTDPSEFAQNLVTSLQRDPKVQKTLGTYLNSALTRGNSLSVRKY